MTQHRGHGIAGTASRLPGRGRGIAPTQAREQDDFGSLGFIVPSEDVAVCVNTLRVWNSTPRN